VFLRMKKDCNKLARELERDGIKATAIHSDRTQAEREQALADFKEGRATALVATDIAARGIDIAELPFVINFELPYVPEDYVHRIGRTGRAGLPGEAISLVCHDEAKLLADIEKLLKRPIPRVPVDGLDERQRLDRSDRKDRPRRDADHEDLRGDKPIRERRPVAPVSMIAADGFDFSKPYEPGGPAAESGETKPADAPRTPARGRPVAALLGGLGTRK
jgi:ATP-dependent RNA helicase RhlE